MGLRDSGGLDELAEVLPGARFYRLDDEGRELGGPACAAPRAPAAEPALAFVMTCAGNNARGNAAVSARAASRDGRRCRLQCVLPL